MTDPVKIPFKRVQNRFYLMFFLKKNFFDGFFGNDQSHQSMASTSGAWLTAKHWSFWFTIITFSPKVFHQQQEGGVPFRFLSTPLPSKPRSMNCSQNGRRIMCTKNCSRTAAEAHLKWLGSHVYRGSHVDWHFCQLPGEGVSPCSRFFCPHKPSAFFFRQPGW